MRRSLLLPALVGALFLLLLPAAAFANRGLQVGREPVGQTLTSSAVTFTAEALSIRCPLTLRGEIDEAAAKVAGATAGEILEATLGTCTGGTGALLTSGLPWAANYASFSGTLPLITGETLDIARIAASATVLGIRCLYEGSLRGTFNATRVTQFTISRATLLALKEGALCPGTATASGTLEASPTMTLSLFEGRAGEGSFVANPTSLNFGMRAVNSTTTIPVALENFYDDRRIHIRRVIVNGSGTFTTSPAIPAGGQLAIRALSRSNLNVIFRPLAAGMYNATIELVDLNGNVILTIPVSGSA